MSTPQRLATLLLRSGALALLSAAAIGVTTSTASAQPRMEIVGGPTVNWGRIAADTLKYTIKIVNAGDKPLDIKEVKPSCGCTTTETLSKNTLAPNDTATVGIAINVKGHHGPQVKKVTITSNDPDAARANMVMTFQADLIQNLAANASMFNMIRNAKIGTDYTSEVELRNVGDEPVTINMPTAKPNDAVAVSFDLKEPKTLQPGETYKLMARVNASKAGMFTSDITIPTNGKYTPELNLKLITQATEDEASAQVPESSTSTQK